MAANKALSGQKSRAAFTRARRRIPGGVNSPVRAWQRLGGKPPVIARGEGPWIIDVDRRRYVDYVLSWGPLLHGHAHPSVVRAVQRAAATGLSFGAPTEAETELADLLCAAVPGMEQVRLVNSGTEATMSALRLARAATGRDLVVKCVGCYHGHVDHLLVAAGSGLATLGRPDSAGVPKAFAGKTVTVAFNDIAAMEKAFLRHAERIAAVIVEPVAGNMGLILPQDGWLKSIRDLCTRHGSLLIFDEVMTGFRTAWGGCQASGGVHADLVCLGKVIGGGMPLAAYGGSRSLMCQMAPEGPCYQAGTLSGNPVAVAAGLATLRRAATSGFYRRQSQRVTRLLMGLRQIADRHGVPVQLAQAGTMWGIFFSERPVVDFASAAASRVDCWQVFFHHMLRGGIYLAPSPFEAAFWSSVHTRDAVAMTLDAAETAFAAVAGVR